MKINFNILRRAFMDVIGPVVIAIVGVFLLIVFGIGAAFLIFSIAGKFTPLILIGIGIVLFIGLLTMFHYETLLLEHENTQQSNKDILENE